MAVSAVVEKVPLVLVEVPSVVFERVAPEGTLGEHIVAIRIDDVVVQLAVIRLFLQQPQRVFLQALQPE